jgi:hypothetical protein
VNGQQRDLLGADWVSGYNKCTPNNKLYSFCVQGQTC